MPNSLKLTLGLDMLRRKKINVYQSNQKEPQIASKI